tara:strand:- start:5423 stop:5614 length:192 start_codon:yes stop_codon:yes gene_type:complete
VFAAIGKLWFVIVLVTLTFFCGFGFLATFEPTENAMVFRTGYALVAGASTAGALFLLIRMRKQ